MSPNRWTVIALGIGALMWLLIVRFTWFRFAMLVIACAAVFSVWHEMRGGDRDN